MMTTRTRRAESPAASRVHELETENAALKAERDKAIESVERFRRLYVDEGETSDRLRTRVAELEAMAWAYEERLSKLGLNPWTVLKEEHWLEPRGGGGESGGASLNDISHISTEGAVSSSAAYPAAPCANEGCGRLRLDAPGVKLCGPCRIAYLEGYSEGFQSPRRPADPKRKEAKDPSADGQVSDSEGKRNQGGS